MRALYLLPLGMIAAAAGAQTPPPPSGDGGLSGPQSVMADAVPDALPDPPANPRDFEGVWVPGFGGAGGGGPPPGAGGGAPGGAAQGGGPPPQAGGGGTLMCAPVQRLNGSGGGMSNLWITGPKMIVMVSEEDMDVRKIHLDAQHPQPLMPQPNGHAIGHWEGNTLVVDIVGFANADGSLSDQHVVERITREKQGKAWTLKHEFTITSGGQTRTQTATEVWRPDLRVYENVCEENYSRFQMVNGQIEVSPLETEGK